MEENQKKEIRDLVERMKRLEKEATFYYGEAREPIEHNIERIKDQLEEILKPYKERIERLEKEASLYYGEAREPIEYNIERIKNQLEELGVDLKEFGLEEKNDEGRPVNDGPVNDEPVNDEPVNDEPVNDEPVNDEPVNDEPVNDGPVNDEPVNNRTVKMPIRSIEIDASKGIAIVHFTNKNREPVTYQIDEIMKNKKTVKWINRVRDEEISKQDRKQMMKKANPVIVKILADYNQEEDYDMLKAYYNNIIGKNEEEMQQPKVAYSLKGSILSPINYRAMKKYAEQEEKLDCVSVSVDKKTTFKEKFNNFINRMSKVKALMPGEKRNKHKQEEYDKLVNKEYMQSLDEKYEEELKGKFSKGLKKGAPTQEQQSETSRKFNEEEIRQETMEDIGKEVDQIMQEDKKEIVKGNSVITNSGEEIEL